VRVAIVHDYLTQRGGAERVVLLMREAFPDAPLYTSLYHPNGTFPEFADADVRTLPLNRIRPFRRYHRLALPLYARAFDRFEVDADVVVCSSSGWAHGVRTRGRKLVYCYAPARWLHQTERYLGGPAFARRVGLALVRRRLQRWDMAAACSADRYLTLSTAVRDRIQEAYGIDADVLAPPPPADPDGPQTPVTSVSASGRPYVLCVSRLLPYKNVVPVVEAVSGLPDVDLVIVGRGPDRRRILRHGGSGVRLLERVDDAELRWLFANAAGLVSAAHEDYGLTVLEAGSFGRPVAVLRDGGFLETVDEGRTGVCFPAPDPESIRAAVRMMLSRTWDPDEIRAHAATFSRQQFIDGLRAAVHNLGSAAGPADEGARAPMARPNPGGDAVPGTRRPPPPRR
jgi:glycosyltransferase involved in cell wall biosynthesis